MNDAALYNQIDGGAPKYIDRGWVSAVYALYRNSAGDVEVQIAIHDMGKPENAQSLYASDLPISKVPIAGTNDGVIDTGLPSAYSAEATKDRYVVTVSIGERSDSALDTVAKFVKAIAAP
jgi:hypothetical protein